MATMWICQKAKQIKLTTQTKFITIKMSNQIFTNLKKENILKHLENTEILNLIHLINFTKVIVLGMGGCQTNIMILETINFLSLKRSFYQEQTGKKSSRDQIQPKSQELILITQILTDKQPEAIAIDLYFKHRNPKENLYFQSKSSTLQKDVLDDKF